MKMPTRSWANYKYLKSKFYIPKKHKPIIIEPSIPKKPETLKPTIIKQSSCTRKKGNSKSIYILLFLIGLAFVASMMKYSNPELITQIENSFKVESFVNITEIEILILKYTNIERKNVDLKELVWDEILSQIAREHSKDMAEKNFFDHENLSGEGPTDRAKRHGYYLHKELGDGWYTEGIAENIGKMTHVNNNEDSIAREQVKAWMESEGHRQNILNPNYDRLGVGVVYDDPWYISTQNFW